MGVWNCMVLVEKPCISCQEKTQSHLLLWYEGSCEAWGEVSSEVFLYQIMIIPLLLKLIRKCGAMEESNCREMKKHSSCVVGCGTKADIILLNCPGPFPCPLLTGIFLTMFDLFHGPGLLRLLKFILIGHVMISGKQLEKSLVKELPTPILQEENKGLYFLLLYWTFVFLWGGSLRVRAVTSGQWFNQ